MISEKQEFLARSNAGQKITGQDAFAAASLGLGELYRSEDGSILPEHDPNAGNQDASGTQKNRTEKRK